MKEGIFLLDELHPEIDSTAMISSLDTLLVFGEGPAMHSIAPAKKESSWDAEARERPQAFL